MRLSLLDCIALILAIIGSLNWGLIAFFQFDLVAFVFGEMTILARIIYALVGLSGVYLIYLAGQLLPK